MRAKLISLRLTPRTLARLDAVAKRMPKPSRTAALLHLLEVYELQDVDAFTLNIKAVYEQGFTASQIRSLRLLKRFLEFAVGDR